MNRQQGRLRRRDFLFSVGRAAGSTAMLRAMAAMGLGGALNACGSSSASPAGSPPPPAPPPPPPASSSPRPGDWPAMVGAGRSVVVLGAGIAGMTAALEMTRLGYSCTLLEATARAGGRNRTIRAGDTVDEIDSTQVCTFDVDPELYFNPGPARIPHHHEFLLRYCREFGVPLETFVNHNRAALLHSPAEFGGEPQLLRRIEADTRGHLARLLALAVDQNALDQELSAADRENVLAVLRHYGDLTGGFDYAGSSRAGFPGQEATGSRRRGELLPPLEFEALIRDSFWQERQDFDEALNQQATMLQPVGGMDRIAEAFRARVEGDTEFNAVVTEIRKTSTGARVVYRDRNNLAASIEADHCVCTIPATVLRDIPNDFSAAHRSAIESFEYTPAAKIAFQSRRFWEQDHNIYGGISWTTQPMTQLWYPSSGFGRDQGVLVGSYIFGGAAGIDFTDRTPPDRILTTTTQAGALHAGFGGETNRGISVAWSKMPFQLGAWGVSDPDILLTADDRIHFAGEHLSTLQGWQEGAIVSAYHAIDSVVAVDTA